MVEIARMPIANAGRGRTRSMSTPQWGALIGGGALAIYGITRKSPAGIALAASGATIALLGANQNASSRDSSAATTLLVNCSRQDAYRLFRDFENLPRFMNRLETVTVVDNRHSRWIAIGPMGRQIQWDAQITDDRENEYIAWQSLPGSDVQVDGSVQFKEAPAGRGTLITARLVFRPAPGRNSSLAKFLSKGANFALRQDLRRLEALLETGEIPTIEGQPHGPRDVVTGVLRVADPTRPIRPGSNLKDIFQARRRIA